MNRDDYLFVLSERDSILSLLETTTDDDIIGKMSLESRLHELNDEISHIVIDEHPPVKATLTFRGAPVLGTYGIAANFGTKIVNAFNDAVSHVASSFSGKLPAFAALLHRVPPSAQLITTEIYPLYVNLKSITTISSLPVPPHRYL